MKRELNTDGARRAALDAIERSERNVKIAVAGAAAVEALLLTAFVLLADLGNRDHVLLLIAALLVYTTLALGLVALAAHVNRSTLRVLRAIETQSPGG